MNIRIDEASGLALDYFFAKALTVKNYALKVELSDQDGFYQVRTSEGFVVDQRNAETIKLVIHHLEKQQIGVMPISGNASNHFTTTFASGENREDLLNQIVKGNTFIEAGMRVFAAKMLGYTYTIDQDLHEKLYNPNPDIKLYHVTKLDALKGIVDFGMQKGSYWTNKESFAQQQGEAIEADGAHAVVLTMSAKSLQPKRLIPMWQEALDVEGSIQYNGIINAKDIKVIPHFEPLKTNKPKI
jgi:hypothetical protein